MQSSGGRAAQQLEKEILDWKGDLQQVDDIMFIGTRIPEPES